MAATFRSKTEGTNTSATTFTFDVPAGTVEGDFLWAQFALDIQAPTGVALTGGADWTLFDNPACSGDGGSIWYYYKIAGASEPATYQFTYTGAATRCAYACAAYEGVDTTTPIAASLVTNPNLGTPPSSPVSMTASAITTTADNQTVLYGGFVDWNSSTACAFTAPTELGGFTERAKQTPSSFVNCVLYEGTKATTGSTGSVTATGTLASASGNYIAALVALTDDGGAQSLTPTRFDNTNTFYAATVEPVYEGLFDGAIFDSVIFDVPSGSSTQTLTPGLFSNTNTFYAPTITAGAVTLTPTRFDNSQTFYAATVSQAGGAQTLTQDSRFDNSQTFYVATVAPGAVSLIPSRHDNNQSFYGHTVTVGAVALTPSRYDNSQTFYSPAVSVGAVALTPGLFTNTNTFYSPTVSVGAVSLAPTRFDNSQTFYGATVAVGGVTLSPTRLDNSQTFFSPTVVSGGALYPDRLNNSQTFYGATVTPGAVALTPSRLDNSQTFYAATVSTSGAPQTVEPPLVSTGNTVYAHVVTAESDIVVPIVSAGNSFYPATVSTGAVVIAPPFFENAQQFFAATVDTTSLTTLTQADIQAIITAVWGQQLPLGVAPSVSYGTSSLNQADLDAIAYGVWNKALP